MIRFLALLAFGISMFGSVSADADRPVLVELFANQNCPACPKAHRAMQQITEERDDVFVLTWTVNYWDYLGDPDPMALAVAKDRQMAYTDRLSLRAPYTPQSFYDGAKECPGTRKRDIRRNIKLRLDDRSAQVPTVVWNGESVSITADPAQEFDITLIEYLSGEANETTMVNPVTDAQVLGSWTSADTAYPVTCENSCAVLLHAPDYGRVLAVQPLN